MLIFFRNLTGKVVPIEVEPTDTTKHVIVKLTNAGYENHRIVICGNEVPIDDRLFSDYRPETLGSIHIIQRRTLNQAV